mmetsp:Transcript_10626/g.17855  ORF Transcript_10626/g.17855 Transcript_10626/m.17855 type:complete len:404 (-) Transcript_10626:37-1248(-)
MAAAADGGGQTESSAIVAPPTASESAAQPDAETPSQLGKPASAADAVTSTPNPEEDAKAVTGPPNAPVVASSNLELSKEEKVLRGLLQYCVCTDAQRKSLLNMRYRELILSYYDNMQETTSASGDAISSSAPAASSGVEEPVGVAPVVATSLQPSAPPNDGHSSSGLEADPGRPDAPAVALAAASDQPSAPASGGSAETAQPSGSEALPAGSSLEDKERLKQQLKAKQEALAQQVQRLRLKAAAGGSTAAGSLESGAPAAGQKASAVQNLDGAAPAAQAPAGGTVTVSPAAQGQPAPDSSVSWEEREEALKKCLKRKEAECVDAEVEVARLEARKAALEELVGRLREDRAAKQQERACALRVVFQRREEEARVLERMKESVASSVGLSLGHVALAGQQITMLE